MLPLDPDDEEATAFLDDLDASGALPKTVSWSTWRGRTIRLYQANDGIQRVRPTKGMKLEVRCGVGHYVIVPPSVISEIFPYSWLVKPGHINIPMLPSRTLETIYNAINVSSHSEPEIYQLSVLWWAAAVPFTALAAASLAILGVLWIIGAVMQGRLAVTRALGIECACALLLSTAVAALAAHAV